MPDATEKRHKVCDGAGPMRHLESSSRLLVGVATVQFWCTFVTDLK